MATVEWPGFPSLGTKLWDPNQPATQMPCVRHMMGPWAHGAVGTALPQPAAERGIPRPEGVRSACVSLHRHEVTQSEDSRAAPEELSQPESARPSQGARLPRLLGHCAPERGVVLSTAPLTPSHLLGTEAMVPMS